MSDTDARRRRLSAFTDVVNTGRIMYECDAYTTFETTMTRNWFLAVASDLAERWIVAYQWRRVPDDVGNPPLYSYVIVVEEPDHDPPNLYDPKFRRFSRPLDDGPTPGQEAIS